MQSSGHWASWGHRIRSTAPKSPLAFCGQRSLIRSSRKRNWPCSESFTLPFSWSPASGRLVVACQIPLLCQLQQMFVDRGCRHSQAIRNFPDRCGTHGHTSSRDIFQNLFLTRRHGFSIPFIAHFGGLSTRMTCGAASLFSRFMLCLRGSNVFFRNASIPLVNSPP